MKTSFHNEFIVNSQQLLYFNVFFGTVIVLYFLLGRAKPKKTTNSLEETKPLAALVDEPPLSVEMTESVEEEILPQVQHEHKFELQQPEQPLAAEVVLDSDEAEIQSTEPEPLIQPIYPTRVKDLSIYFMFNGHEWEAHEVLGVPKGASLQMATESYQQLIKKSDVSTYEFYELAHLAILQCKSRRF